MAFLWYTVEDCFMGYKGGNMRKILPKYSYIPIVLLFTFNMITYFGTKAINANMEHHTMEIFLDDLIPSWNFFIVFYVLAYLQWVVGFVMIARDSRELCYEYFAGEIIAKGICFLFFVLYPTMMIRPEIVDGNVFDWMTSVIYQIDQPNNLFPSIHCLESWIIARAAFKQKKTSKAYAYVMLILTILVFASTVLVKQHVFVDIIGGIAVVEIGLFLSRKIGFGERKYIWTRKK